ncbi:MAG: hypothetical protein PF517_11390 [Salinivirgaceae bacterium]|jgi:hypothetical protein|nr:hypothetical protein [Salinivirgaceae bacterium]
MIRIIIIIAIAFLLALGNQTHGQENVNQEVKVIKPYEPVINDAFKISELPKIVDTNKVIPKFEYDIVTDKHATGFKPKPINPARLVSEPLSKLYYGHLKAGFGLNLSPLADAYIGSKRSEDLNWHVNLHHNSLHGKIKNEESKKVYAGLSNSEANAQINYFTNNSKVLSFNTEYSNKKNYYYGYNPAAIIGNLEAPLLKDSIENQSINFLKVKANWRTNHLDSANVNYNIDLGWQTLSGKNGIGENALKLETNFDYFFENEFIGADLFLNYYSKSGIEDTVNGAIVKFSPWIGAFGKKWRTVVGVSTFYDQANEKYHFYPRVSMHYNIIDYFLIPYLEVDGNYTENSYKDIYRENPFIKQSIGVKPTDTKMNITFGFRGNISSKIAFNAKVNYTKIADQYFFVNDTSIDVPLQNKFNVVYDDLTRMRLLAELSYKTGENLFLTFKANYFKYKLDNETKPWHMPNYRVSLNARYIVQKKIIFDANIFAIGDRYVREFEAGVQSEKSLQGIIDLNLGVEYRLSKVFSAFAYFNNISSVRYYEWNHYPSQHFNVMVGLSYSF